MLMSSPSLPHGPATAQALISMGFRPTPLASDTKIPILDQWNTRIASIKDFGPDNSIGIVCGRQLDGTFLVPLDFDNKPDKGINAEDNFQAFIDQILNTPIIDKIFITRSTSGTGYHIWLRLARNLAKGTIRNAAGKKIGDLMGQGGQIVMQPRRHWVYGQPDRVKTLTESELAIVLRLINYQQSIDADLPQIAWTATTSVSRLHNSRGLPARLPDRCRALRILAGKEPIRDTSEGRYAVCYELVACGYSDDEVATLLLHHCEWGKAQQKGEAWLQKDIRRCIARCRKAQPDVTTDPEAWPEQAALLAVDPGGRPRKQTLEEFRYYLRQNLVGPDRVMKTQAEIAADLGISRRTVQRREAELAVEVNRHISADGKHSYLELITCDKTPPAYAPTREMEYISQDLDPTTAVIGVGGVGEGVPAVAGQSCLVCAGSVAPDPGGVLRCQQCGSVPSVPRLVDEALDAYGDARAGNKRTSAIVAFVRENGRPDAREAWVVRLAREMHADRKQVQRDAEFSEMLAVLSDKQLKAKQRGLERKAEDAHKGGNPKQAFVFGRMSWWVERELMRPERQAKATRAKAIQHVLGGGE